MFKLRNANVRLPFAQVVLKNIAQRVKKQKVMIHNLVTSSRHMKFYRKRSRTRDNNHIDRYHNHGMKRNLRFLAHPVTILSKVGKLGRNLGINMLNRIVHAAHYEDKAKEIGRMLSVRAHRAMLPNGKSK